MNVQNLENKQQELIMFMEGSGYSANYIGRLKCEIKSIISDAEAKNWASYADIYADYTQQKVGTQNLILKHALLGIIEDFDINGQLPDGHRRHNTACRSKYHLLSREFKTAIDYYCETEEKRGIKNATIYVSSRNTSGLLYDLQLNGISQFSEITEEAILSSFINPDGVLRRGHSFKKNVTAVFKTCAIQNPDVFNRILSFLPRFRKNQKNIQYITLDESEQLRQTFIDSDSSLSFRDRAVGVLAFYTGMRSCDIAGLTLSSIDWDNDTITIKQQKTDNALQLPLSAIVGNAIFDYLTIERPKTDCEYVFLSTRGPIRRMGSDNMRSIAKKIMKAANIRQSAGDRKGLHIFRHHIATQLLQNNVPRPVISKTLGHESPKSLDAYLSADFKHLKECALSISRFQAAEEVFGDA